MTGKLAIDYAATARFYPRAQGSGSNGSFITGASLMAKSIFPSALFMPPATRVLAKSDASPGKRQGLKRIYKKGMLSLRLDGFRRAVVLKRINSLRLWIVDDA